jgi:hypothetical protein
MQTAVMTFKATVCGLFGIAAGLAEAAPAPSCLLQLDGAGRIGVQRSGDAPLPDGAARLCAALRSLIGETPALRRALARDRAQLLVEITDIDDTGLSARLVLRRGGTDLAGSPLTLRQSDRIGIAPAALDRLARHLLATEPIPGFTAAP